MLRVMLSFAYGIALQIGVYFLLNNLLAGPLAGAA
jgi:hypothetical protein